MRRLPLVPTILVALAVAAMIGLGMWQLARRHEKLRLIGEYSANPQRPPIAFPRFPVGHDELLFRRASAFCLRPTGWDRQVGRSVRGTSGWQLIARCATGAEGPGFRVAMGVTTDPKFTPQWKGGMVRGRITHAPRANPLIARLFGRPAPQELMLVSDTPAAGLEQSVPPDTSSVPNNHLAYAVQWFVFAALAAVIYALALRGRWKGAKSQV